MSDMPDRIPLSSLEGKTIARIERGDVIGNSVYYRVIGSDGQVFAEFLSDEFFDHNGNCFFRDF